MSDEVQRSLGRIEGKLDKLDDMLAAHLADDTQRFNRVNDRIGRVERKAYAASGVIAIVSAYVTAKLSGH